MIELSKAYNNLLIKLNDPELAEYTLINGICLDSVEFLDLRAAVLFSGEDRFLRVINGEYSFSKKEIEIAQAESLANFLGPNLRMLISLAYGAKTGKKIISSDREFIDEIKSQIFSEFDHLAPRRNRDEIAKRSHGTFVQEVNIDRLGLVRPGDFLMHSTYGISYVYRILRGLNNVHTACMINGHECALFNLEGGNRFSAINYPR